MTSDLAMFEGKIVSKTFCRWSTMLTEIASLGRIFTLKIYHALSIFHCILLRNFAFGLLPKFNDNPSLSISTPLNFQPYLSHQAYPIIYLRSSHSLCPTILMLFFFDHEKNPFGIIKII